MGIRDRGIADVDVRQAAERDDIACVGGFNGSAAIGLKAVQRGDAPFFGEIFIMPVAYGHLPVSYTHLDVYKRQVRWSSGSLGENGNFYPTVSQAGEGLENDGPFRVLHIG